MATNSKDLYRPYPDKSSSFDYRPDYRTPSPTKEYNVHPEQLSFDHATTSNIYASLQKLQGDVEQIKKFIAETPELLKDVVEQMHQVLAALDDLNDAASK
jgi:hypothetical protein